MICQMWVGIEGKDYTENWMLKWFRVSRYRKLSCSTKMLKAMPFRVFFKVFDHFSGFYYQGQGF
jgi:hypothetical protein